MALNKIKSEIEALSLEDFVQLHRWIAEKDWGLWDAQLEKDVASRKFDFLREEVAAVKARAQC